MKDKKFYQRAFRLIAVFIFAVFFMSPESVEAEYYVGTLGIYNRTINVNLGDYTDLNNLENPLSYAREIFTTSLDDSDLSKMGLKFVGMSEEITGARMAEAQFQLDHGNPTEAVKLFDKKLDYFIYGYIDNLTITHRESLGGSNLTVRVDLTAKIVDASTGKTVCIATGKGESASHGESGRKSFKMGGKEISDVCWGEAVEKATDQIVLKIKKQI